MHPTLCRVGTKLTNNPACVRGSPHYFLALPYRYKRTHRHSFTLGQQRPPVIWRAGRANGDGRFLPHLSHPLPFTAGLTRRPSSSPEARQRQPFCSLARSRARTNESRAWMQLAPLVSHGRLRDSTQNAKNKKGVDQPMKTLHDPEPSNRRARNSDVSPRHCVVDATKSDASTAMP